MPIIESAYSNEVSATPSAGVALTGDVWHTSASADFPVPTAPVMGNGHGMVALDDVLLLLAAGESAYSSCYEFDPAVTGTGAYTAVTSLPSGRRYSYYGAPNGVPVIAGGVSGSTRLSSTLALDRATGTWATRAAMPTANAYGGSAVDDGRLHAIAGAPAAGTSSNTHYEHDEATDTWATRASYPISVNDNAGAGFSGGVHSLGGFQNISPGTVRSEHYRYERSSGAWTAQASIMARVGPSAFAIGSGLYRHAGHLAGAGDPNYRRDTERFDEATAAWATAASGPRYRGYAPAAVLGGLAYVNGGYSGSVNYANTDVYVPPEGGFRPY